MVRGYSELPLEFKRNSEVSKETPEQRRRVNGALILMAQRGNAKARERLIKRHAKIALKFALRRNHKMVETADIFAEALRGLNHAIDRATPSMGFQFTSYAFWWIKAYVSRFIDETKTTVRIPHNIQHSGHKARKKYLRGETLNPKENADHDACYGANYRTTISDLVEDMEIGHMVISLSCDDTQEQDVTAEMRSVYVTKMLQDLNENQRTVMIHLYGLNGSKPQTLTYIAEVLGLSKERVRQISETSRIIMAKTHRHRLAAGLAPDIGELFTG